MGSYFMKHWERMEMRIFFKKEASVSDQSARLESIRQWHMAATSTGFGGEMMQPGELRINSPSITRKGLLAFPITIPYPQPVAYPWLELWLILRSGLPLSRRFRGIVFVNPP